MRKHIAKGVMPCHPCSCRFGEAALQRVTEHVALLRRRDRPKLTSFSPDERGMPPDNVYIVCDVPMEGIGC